MIILSYSCRGDKDGNESQLKMVTIQKDFSFKCFTEVLQWLNTFWTTLYFQSSSDSRFAEHFSEVISEKRKVQIGEEGETFPMSPGEYESISVV